MLKNDAKVYLPSEFLWKVSGMRSCCFKGAPVTGCLPYFIIYGVMFLNPSWKPQVIINRIHIWNDSEFIIITQCHWDFDKSYNLELQQNYSVIIISLNLPWFQTYNEANIKNLKSWHTTCSDWLIWTYLLAI